MALLIIFKEILYRIFVIEGRVRDFCVVIDKPFGEILVQLIQISKEEVFIVIDKLLLNGSIESFVMGFHFRAFWICPVVVYAVFFALFLVSHKRIVIDLL